MSDGAAPSWRAIAVAAVVLLAGAALALLAMGRPPICTCGDVAIWHGALDAGNSQHLLDWYSPSHLIHGLIFYAIGHVVARRRPVRLRLLAALAVEIGWELVENSPPVIARYRAATIALGYNGDSVINSLADVGCMTAGFLIAARLPWRAGVALALGLELVTLAVIRDGLALNILMLLWPIGAVRVWQAG